MQRVFHSVACHEAFWLGVDKQLICFHHALFCIFARMSSRPGNCIIDAIHELEEMEDVVMAGGEVKLPKVSERRKQGTCPRPLPVYRQFVTRV